MASIIAQVFGLTFVGIIMICLAWTIVSYIVNDMDTTNKRKKYYDKSN